MTTLKSVAIAVGLCSSAFGQATSPVVGYTTENLQTGFNLFGVTLHSKPVASGTFESDLTDDDADFAAVLVDAEATYLLEVESGAQAGAVAEISGNTATSLTAGGLVTGAAEYSIREALTLEDVFGTSLTGSFNATAADIVWIPDGLGGFNQYFYSTTGSQFRPTNAPFAVAEPVPVFYPDGMFVEVKSGSPSVTVSGDLKEGATAVSNMQGFNVAANPGPVGVTLGTIGLEATLTGSFNATAADIVWLPDGAGGFNQYFFNSTASVWRPTSSPFSGDSSEVVVPSAFFIERKTPGTTVVANTPSYYAGL
ncbi:hypothetical protein ACFFQ7_06690 [Roseibacillus persicicus]